MQYHDTQYLELMRKILKDGDCKETRTGIDSISIFGGEMVFDLSDGTIPLLTTKRVHIKSIIHELLWFLSGSTNVKGLNTNGVTIWDEWADEAGELGPVYGCQWRRWEKITIVRAPDIIHTTNNSLVSLNTKIKIEYIDQISILIDQIKNNPNSRRLMVSAWNVGQLDEMNLPPCHYGFQCYVSSNGVLSLKVTQRSCDFFIGVPFNIAQYGILLHMLAHVCNLKVGKLIWSGGDIHIYTNHLEQCDTQLNRSYIIFESPTLELSQHPTDIFDFKYEDFIIHNYKHYPTISAPIAV